MKNYVSELKQNFANQLAAAALNYLHAGLSMFYDLINCNEPVNPQVALGNISIGVELMLKAFIARKSLLLLFKELSLEARTLLLCSDNLPPNFNWRPHDLELRSATKKIIDFGDCETILFIFFPGLKQPLKSHLDAMIAARNSSVHSVLPSFQEYELQRSAYVALKILDALSKAGALPVGCQRDEEDDEKFLKSFQEAKLKQVQEKLEKAKESAKKLTGEQKSVSMDAIIAQDPFLYWARLITKCPICGNEAILEGYTDILTSEADEYGPEETFLGLFPDKFQCDWCGLQLEDYDELQSAGIKSMYERDDEVETFNREVKQLAELEGWNE